MIHKLESSRSICCFYYNGPFATILMTPAVRAYQASGPQGPFLRMRQLLPGFTNQKEYTSRSVAYCEYVVVKYSDVVRNLC